MGKKGILNGRLFGSVLFVAVVAGFIALREITLIPFDVFAMVVSLIGAFEIMKMLGEHSKKSKILLVVYCAILPFLHIYFGGYSIFICAIIIFVINGIIAIFENVNIIDNMRNFAFTLIYPIILLSLLVIMNHWEGVGTIAILFVFMVGPFCDVGAYLFGVTIKGKKLCPQISPNKTIAGAVGGLVGGVIGGISVYFISFNYIPEAFSLIGEEVLFYVFAGAMGAFFAEIGDLLESAIKRCAEVKDSGNIIPGHGGILDRFDGIILVVVFVYIYFMAII